MNNNLITIILGSSQGIIALAGFVIAFTGFLFADSPHITKWYWFAILSPLLLVLFQFAVQLISATYFGSNPAISKWVHIIFLIINIVVILYGVQRFGASQSRNEKGLKEVRQTEQTRTEINQYKSILKERALTADELRKFVTYFNEDTSITANVALKNILTKTETSSNFKNSIDDGGVLMFELSKRSLNFVGIEALVEAGTDINYVETGENNKNALMEYVDTIDVQDSTGVCNKSDILATVVSFIDKGIDINHKDTAGHNALWYIENKFNLFTKEGTAIPQDTVCINQLAKAYAQVFASNPENSTKADFIDRIQKPVNLLTGLLLANRLIDVTKTTSTSDTAFVIVKATKDSEGYNFYYTTQMHYATKDIKYAIPDNAYIKVLFDGKAAYKTITK